MQKDQLLNLLNAIARGEITPDTALHKLQAAPFDDLGYAKVDHHRGIRQGANEVIFGAGKTKEHIRGIILNMKQRGAENIIITRLSEDIAEYLSADGEIPFEYHETARLGVAFKTDIQKTGCITVASGGTSDMPVCEEAALTAEYLGNNVIRLYDVGVAGLHRLLSKLDVLQSARCIIAVAGMEGALPSVIGGLVSCPVIAVPTSIGYGANLGGIAALLSMLNSCASGVAVVNIDNGFGAGYMANMINKLQEVTK